MDQFADAIQDARLSVLAAGMGFTEGPVFCQSGEIVVTSIDRGHLYKVTEDGAELFAVTGGGPNGATEGLDGTIYVCQNGGRGPGWKRPAMTGGIQAVRPDGAVEWVTKDPISPNDLCFGPDGYLYVTDPTRGAGRNDGRLWRIDTQSNEAELLTSVPWYPNGIGFGREDDAMYVASTRAYQIVRFPLDSNGLGEPEVVIQFNHGRADGFAFDTEDNLVIGLNGDDAGPAEIQVWNKDRQLIESIRPSTVGHHCTNVAISADGRLIVTYPELGAVLEMSWPYGGLPLYPFRTPPTQKG